MHSYIYIVIVFLFGYLYAVIRINVAECFLLTTVKIDLPSLSQGSRDIVIYIATYIFIYIVIL